MIERIKNLMKNIYRKENIITYDDIVRVKEINEIKYNSIYTFNDNDIIETLRGQEALGLPLTFEEHSVIASYNYASKLNDSTIEKINEYRDKKRRGDF